MSINRPDEIFIYVIIIVFSQCCTGIVRILLLKELFGHSKINYQAAQINPPFHSSEDNNFSISPMVTHACCDKPLLFTLFKLGSKILRYRLAKYLRVGPVASCENAASGLHIQLPLMT